MTSAPSHQPRDIPQVMISSTFTDLKEHRAALIKVIKADGLTDAAMENDSAKIVDVIKSSLSMVADSAAYVAILSKRYGQIPKCPTRNPKGLSITELEFDEALRLGRPILLFIMGKGHLVLEEHIEAKTANKKKLKSFIDRAKRKSADSEVHRVYAEFADIDEFKEKIGPAISALRRYLDSQVKELTRVGSDDHRKATGNPIPAAPAFYAEPDYIGSHEFVGREAELQALSDWAMRADPTNLLLFEAIGGNGKSMLTWHWAKDETQLHATKVRPDWAGRFWYSFYERGAIMEDFCQRALAYMSGRPLEEFRKLKTAQMKDDLIAQLHARPWLLILDGLERVLVAYHRIDAAEVPDEEANAPTDKVLDRNPCDAIRDEDGDLLRALAACAPSKILVSSRLTPRVLLNPSGQPIQGARRIPLPGLRPPDAEALLRSCGITGDSAAIQDYLTKNCDNHPLVIGILAGLITNYLPDRGNFDAWSVDRNGGAGLDLGKLDLIQRRNHILRAAIDALPDASRQLLSTLALLSESVDSKTLEAFNPHPSGGEGKLSETVRDLEQRGLLQYDGRERHYDLHPVVRGVAAGGMKVEDKERYGQRVVDHFNAQPHRPYEIAQTMEDLSSGLHVVRTLLKLGYFQRAADAYMGDLSAALLFNLESYAETLSLLRPFFPSGWGEPPIDVDARAASYLANSAAIALGNCGEHQEGFVAYGVALKAHMENDNWKNAVVCIRNISSNLIDQYLMAKALRVDALALDLASACDDEEDVFMGRLFLFADQSRLGQWQAAEATWKLLDPMGRDWQRGVYRQGDAEWHFARFQFLQVTLQEKHLTAAASLAEQDNNRGLIRDLHWLRGAWRQEQGERALAAASFKEAVRMARERRLVHEASETGLALAKFHLGQLTGEDAHSEAKRLAQMRQPAHRSLARLWLAMGDHEQAKHHALAAYKSAWADGEPYVHRYELTKTTELLREMKVPVPELPPYDAAKDEPFPWEAEVRAAIERLRKEKEAKKKRNGEVDADEMPADVTE